MTPRILISYWRDIYLPSNRTSPFTACEAAGNLKRTITCLIRREGDLPHLLPLLGCLQLTVNVGHGAVAVLAAIGEGGCAVVGVRLDYSELVQQVGYVLVPQDWVQH